MVHFVGAGPGAPPLWMELPKGAWKPPAEGWLQAAVSPEDILLLE